MARWKARSRLPICANHGLYGSTAVVKATSQSNGKGQILTPWGFETPERMSMKLGIYNRAAGMITHANPCGAATTWVVWANT